MRSAKFGMARATPRVNGYGSVSTAVRVWPGSTDRRSRFRSRRIISLTGCTRTRASIGTRSRSRPSSRTFSIPKSKFEEVIGTDSTDLDGFIDHKAKDITYHGVADQLIFSRGTTNYFERLHKKYGAQNVDKFARLFRVPGMGHCGGGAGPNSFGNGLPIPEDPEHDIFLALVNWVEFGKAPDQVIATKYVNDNPASGIAFTRPLCVFPNIAKYKGSGNPADATNWTCVKEIVSDTTEDADEVLRDRGDGDRDDRPGDH